MINYNQIITELLNKRGIVTDEDIEEFLSDKPQKTYDPSLLADAQAGVDFILAEIAAGSKICIYGDYDADGITSTALMLSVLRKLMPKEKLDYYIPSRFEEGYGLNKEAVKQIAGRGFQMIITVDCGSVSADEVEYAKSLGMKIVVTDHHNITDAMADCLLINPKRPGGVYPFKELSGCGVAFKTAQLIQKKAGLPKSVLSEVLDLVAIGTVGDIMPLLDENRTMVKFGLKMINTGHRYGLRKLIEGAGLSCGDITAENVGFVIVPHLNASGRIEDASQAVKLLLEPEGSEEANAIVQDLLLKNRERRRLQQQTFDNCTQNLTEIDDFLLLKLDDAHEGITGIVAGKIKDKYNRPTVLVTPSGDEKQYLKGTGRSIEGVNLYNLLKHHEECFEKFGGHAGACGFLMPAENLTKLREGLLADMVQIRQESPDIFEKKRPYDMDIEPEDATIELAEAIEKLAPFGNRNPKPVFRMCDVQISDVRYMGEDGQHVRFKASQGGGPGDGITCVLFGRAKDYTSLLEERRHADELAGTLDCQLWQGVKRLQLMVSWMDER